MSRSTGVGGVARSSGGGGVPAAAAGAAGAVSAVKLGDSKLLRTKHIDTLEVLETYSKDLTRLQKENKELAHKIANMVTRTNGAHGREAQQRKHGRRRRSVNGLLMRALS